MIDHIAASAALGIKCNYNVSGALVLLRLNKSLLFIEVRLFTAHIDILPPIGKRQRVPFETCKFSFFHVFSFLQTGDFAYPFSDPSDKKISPSRITLFSASSLKSSHAVITAVSIYVKRADICPLL